MEIIEKEPHAILNKKIYDCGCKPWRNGVNYCEECQKAVIDFMNRYGAGTLTNDIIIENLLKDNVKIAKENISLKSRLESKIKRVEELKTKLATYTKPKQSFEEKEEEITKSFNKNISDIQDAL